MIRQKYTMYSHANAHIFLRFSQYVTGWFGIRLETQERTWPGDVFAWKREAFRQAGEQRTDA